jgi:hypothetical protein
MEKKIDENPLHRQMYNNFMKECERLGHMIEVSSQEDFTDTIVHYLPYHPVFKPSGTTTKLRVVFNASCKASNDLSLNDCLCVGLKVLQDLFKMLTRLCQHQFEVVADVQMMYRQTLIDFKQTHMQRIVWRSDPNQSNRDSSWKWPPTIKWDFNFLLKQRFRAAKMFKIKCILKCNNQLSPVIVRKLVSTPLQSTKSSFQPLIKII